MNTTTVSSDTLFCDYYKKWITVYKEGAIRPITMNKYKMAHQWLVKLIPTLTVGDIDRISYQQLLNDYAQNHERQTTMDFHHHIKCAILDAVDEGLISRALQGKLSLKAKNLEQKSKSILTNLNYIS